MTDINREQIEADAKSIEASLTMDMGEYLEVHSTATQEPASQPLMDAIDRAPGHLRALLARVAELEAEVSRLRVCVAEQKVGPDAPAPAPPRYTDEELIEFGLKQDFPGHHVYADAEEILDRIIIYDFEYFDGRVERDLLQSLKPGEPLNRRARAALTEAMDAARAEEALKQ